MRHTTAFLFLVLALLCVSPASAAIKACLACNATCGASSADMSWNITYPLLDGSRTLTDIWNFGGYNISGAGNPEVGTDVATKDYVDTEIAGVSPSSIDANDTEVLYDMGGVAGGSPCMTFDNTTGKLTACYFSGDGTDITNVTADARAIDFRVQEGGVGTLRKGQAVYISGSNGANAQVLVADGTQTAKTRVVGLMTTDTTINAVGYVRRYGQLTEVDTRATNAYVNPLGQTWNAGDLLFAATGGGLTNVRPTSGRSVKAAYTIKGSSASDILLAYPMENPVWVTGAVGEDVVLRLGDSIGVNKVSVRNYANTEVSYFNSYGLLNVLGNNITGIKSIEANTDAVNLSHVVAMNTSMKDYVDAHSGGSTDLSWNTSYLPRAGTSSMTGALSMSATGTNLINNVTDPVGLQDAATANWVVNRTPVVFKANNGTVVQGGMVTGTQVKFTNEIYDTGGYYDAPNSKFTPLIGGYYYIHAQLQVSSVTSGKYVEVIICVNGATVHGFYTRSGSPPNLPVSTVVYCDGIDDYVEVYFLTDDSARTNAAEPITVTFEGYKL